MIKSWYRTAWTSKSCASGTDMAVVVNGVSSYRRLSVNTGTSDWNLRLQCNRGSLRRLTGNHRRKVRPQEYKFFNEAAWNFKLKSSRKGPVADAKMSENRAAFVRSPKRRTIFQTSISQSMVHKILWSPLRFTSYKYLFSFSFYETKTKKIRYALCCDVLSKIERRRAMRRNFCCQNYF
jgi:hypothetical protein